MSTSYQDLEPGYNKSLDLKNVYLHNYVFHYNIYTKTWAAIPRENYVDYWSDYNHPNILRAKDINDLISLVQKTKGDPVEIEKILVK